MQADSTVTSFQDELALSAGAESLRACYACGTCVSRCIIPWRDRAYNPRRLFHKVILSMREEVFEDMTIWHCTACDLCYAGCPQEVRISDVIGALRALAVGAGYTSPLETVVVDPVLCSGCGNCVELCPYDALSLARQEERRVSTVDHNRCMGCGLCVAVCPNSAIGGGSFADHPILEQMVQGLERGRQSQGM